jgi:hypothetical protein
MHISVSKAGGAIVARNHLHFNHLNVDRETLKKHITASVWSPIVWKEGKRKKVNFIACSMLVLDFDSGEWTIADTIDFLQETGIKGMIGTTKSHQKDKVLESGVIAPACDRFRLCLALEKPITDPLSYTIEMEKLTRAIPCDRACKDLARLYYPCKEIVYETPLEVQGVFKVMDEAELIEAKESLREVQEANLERMTTLKEVSMLPKWIATVLVAGTPPGTRNTTIFKVAAELYKFGWNEAEIVAALVSSPLSGIGEDELRTAVANGIKGVGNTALY